MAGIKRLCAVHGTPGMPYTCDTGTVRGIHSRDSRPRTECEFCADCCKRGRIHLGEPWRAEKTIVAIRQRRSALEAAGVDPDQIIAHIQKTGALPKRHEVSAKPVKWAEDGHCSLVIPGE